MVPFQHIEWLQDNVAWFERLSIDDLDIAVPNCPGWTVTDALNHLSFGVGRSYPVALTKPPQTPANEVFTAVGRPSQYPNGRAALSTLSTLMRECIEAFESTNPSTPCWTYGGPGFARFWFRRAAIETALHKIDVEEAISDSPPEALADDRAFDAIDETLSFVLLLAAQMVDPPRGRLTVSSPAIDIRVELGEGSRQAAIEGEGQDILMALWGRHRNRVNVSGDSDIARGWLSLIETAFAGR